jgi:hypothetical protein
MMDMYVMFDDTKQFEEEKIGLSPLSSGKRGGSFLFVMPYQKSRETMLMSVQALREK